MKGKIVGINTCDTKAYSMKTHVRIKVDVTTQNNYNKFRQELLDKFEVSKRGIGGYSELVGQNFDINVFKRDDYVHIVIYANKRMREKILNILVKYFEFVKNMHQLSSQG